MIMMEYARRVLAALVLLVLLASPARAQWVTDGVPLCADPSWQGGVAVAAGATGDAIACWSDGRAGTSDVYAQRINSVGEVQWTTDGVAICTARWYAA